MLPFYYEPERKNSGKQLILVLLLIVTSLLALYWFVYMKPKAEIQKAEQLDEVNSQEYTTSLSDWVDEQPTIDDGETPSGEPEKEFPVLPPPPPPSMAKMKTKGCVADGFLSGYGGDINSSLALINRSECYYLHRSLETWLKPPDFKLARKIQEKVTKPNTVYGMFIAEAIGTRKDYYYPDESREFDFDKMCRPGSKNYWGEHSCKPSLEREEYQKYVEYITEEAMNMGIQVFLFGQVFYQDAGNLDETYMPEVIRKMREHAEYLGMEIFVGAQTNDITDEKYLRLYDFIEGGVGLQADGSIEGGPCFSRWWKKPGDWCWALLWHPQFASKANNVFVHFDWSGKLGDDMSVFTRMEKNERMATLKRLHAYFTSKNTAFLMPVLATLHRDNGGCSGPKKRFYSASKKYSCQDEEVINDILRAAK